MAKTELTRKRLLLLMDILRTETDENHRLTMPKLLERLRHHGIEADRRTVYDDIRALEDAGWDILTGRAGYCLASRDFELPELKLLADAVQCSRCITEKKSYELIKKLSGLTSLHDAGKLRRQLHLVGRPKAENEQLYYNVDALYEAIDQNSAITFRYLDYQYDGTRTYRKKRYEVSPYGLCWDTENYYLVAHEEGSGKRHYRVDRMADIELTHTPRLSPELYKNLNMAEYGKKVFGMFGGEEKQVTLEFPKELANNAVDRFGTGIMMIPQDENTFRITTPVSISPVFYSWVFSFLGRVKIIAPEDVRQEYLDCLRNNMDI